MKIDEYFVKTPNEKLYDLYEVQRVRINCALVIILNGMVLKGYKLCSTIQTKQTQNVKE